MAGNLSQRPAVAGDIDALYEIHRLAMRPCVKLVWGWDENWQANHFRKHFRPAFSRVICVDGQAIGMLVVEERSDGIALVSIEIAPSHHGQGIGTRLIQELLQQAADRNVGVRLQVLKVNVRARSLYERLGFRAIGESPTHVQMQAEPPSPSTR